MLRPVCATIVYYDGIQSWKSLHDRKRMFADGELL